MLHWCIWCLLSWLLYCFYSLQSITSRNFGGEKAENTSQKTITKTNDKARGKSVSVRWRLPDADAENPLWGCATERRQTN